MAAETEIDFYARVGNNSGFSKAAKVITQEQAEIKNDGSTTRVRMMRSDGGGDWEYELTTKIKLPPVNGVKASDEYNTPISAAAYEVFKKGCSSYMRKIRFVFNVETVKITAPGLDAELTVPGLCYEVDRFITKDGELSEYVKIDVELDAIYTALKAAGITAPPDLQMIIKASGLPFEPKDILFDDGSKEETRAFITKLYSEQFISPNLNHPKAKKAL